MTILKPIIFSLNFVYVFNSADEKEIMPKIQFDVIMTSLPVEVLLYVESFPEQRKIIFQHIQYFGKIPR